MRAVTSRLARCGLALYLLLKIPGVAAELQPALTDVFVGGREGYHTYRIPVLVVATNGTVLAFCEARKTSARDNGEVDLLLKRSEDSGKTWGPRQVIWSDKGNTCGNPAPVVDVSSGVIWLLATWNLGSDQEEQIISGTSKNTRRVFVTHSGDNGTTWARPVEITDAVKEKKWGWYATGPVNGIQLTRGEHKGRLIIPANHSELNAHNEPITRAHVIFSDDHGRSWRIGGIEEEKTNESTLVELSNGSLLHNMRSYRGQNCRAVATSHDGGMSWSAVTLDPRLIEPVCQASILRCTWPGDGEKSRILFSNPASVKREKLTVRISYDEGTTWPVHKVIHEGPAAYSCLTVLPDQSIACLLECGKKSPYEKISFVHFPVSWLERN